MATFVQSAAEPREIHSAVCNVPPVIASSARGRVTSIKDAVGREVGSGDGTGVGNIEGDELGAGEGT